MNKFAAFDRERLLVLADGMLGGRLGKEELLELDRILCGNLSAQQFYVQFLDIDVCVTRIAAESMPAVVATPEVSRAASGLTRAFRGYRSLAVITACTVALVACIALVPVLSPPPEIVGRVLALSDEVHWKKRALPLSAVVRAGDSIEIKYGLVSLTLNSGAVVDLLGPGRWVVEDGTAIEMPTGKLRAVVPKAARGFTVRTPDAEIVDLGTEFLMKRDYSAGTEVSVRKGVVRASTLDGSGRVVAVSELTQGRAAKFDAGAFRETTLRVEDYRWFDSVRGGIVSLSGVARTGDAFMADLRLDQSPTRDHVRVIPEKAGVSLTEDAEVLTVSGPQTLAAGDRLSSYLVHFDPGAYATEPPIGAFGVNGHVVAIISDSAELNRLDDAFGLDGTTYEQRAFRGLELGEDLDEVGVSEDRRSVRFNFDLTAPHYFDEVRILVREDG